MAQKYIIAALIFFGALFLCLAVLYIVFQESAYAFASLLAVGLLNIINGVVSLRNEKKAAGIIFIVGGALLTLLMLYALLSSIF